MTRLAARFGWRGLWLMLLGAFFFLFGVGIVLDPLEPRPWVLYEMLPPVVQASGWWITGAVAFWQGSRGPDRNDAWGHVALYLMPAVRLLSFAVSWAVYAITWLGSRIGLVDEVIGYQQGWFAALIWSLISAMLALAAAWPNPVPSLPSPPADATADGVSDE